MLTTTRPRQACVQFADPAGPAGVQVSSSVFLEECLGSARSRFRRRGGPRDACRTIEHPVPPKPRCPDSTGLIVAHVSGALCSAWEKLVVGTAREKRAHVEEQIHLALADLADQDMHGYLAVTDEQCEIYDPDLVQLVTESLARTTFSHVGRMPDPHWEGTLVEQVRPPFLLLAVSIGLADGPPGPARPILPTA